jgi:hypothetical protein
MGELRSIGQLAEDDRWLPRRTMDALVKTTHTTACDEDEEAMDDPISS